MQRRTKPRSAPKHTDRLDNGAEGRPHAFHSAHRRRYPHDAGRDRRAGHRRAVRGNSRRAACARIARRAARDDRDGDRPSYARARGARRPPAQFHRRRRLRAPYSVRGLGNRDARRVLQCVYAVPGRGEPGHAAAAVRVPDHDVEPDRPRYLERVALRRRVGSRRGLPHGRTRESPLEIATHPAAGGVEPDLPRCRARGRREPEPRVRTAALRPEGRPHVARRAWKPIRGQDITAVVVQQPNFFGTLEDVDAITELGARERRAA